MQDVAPLESVPELPATFVPEKELGRGGMGLVLQAHHRGLARPVAIKVLLESLIDDPTWFERLEQEAKLAARVKHPNLVKVLEWGRHEGTGYIVFELVEGPSLRTLLARNGAFRWREAAEIGATIADSLAALHAVGILHRDIKPDNILMASHGPVLADLGIAKDLAGGRVKTRTGMLLGTPEYLAPDLLTPEGKPSAAIDVYSLGIVLHELVAGTVPFSASNLGDLLRAHIHEAPPSLALLGVDCPAPLAALINRCLDKDPKRRPDAATLASDLGQILAHPTGEAGLLRSGKATQLPRPNDPKSTVVTNITTATPPTGARRRAGAVIAVLAILAAVRPRDPAPPPALSPASAASAAAPLPPAASPTPPVTSVMMPLTPAENRKALSGLTSNDRSKVEVTLQHLTSKTGFDLLWGQDEWTSCLLLVQFLRNEGTIPPYLRSPVPLHELERLAYQPARVDFDKPTTPSLAGQAYRLAIDLPRHGQSWIILGRLLERHGHVAESLRCYEMGLERLEGVDLFALPLLFWQGLLVALVRVPGHDITREWPVLAKAGRNEPVVWSALREHFQDSKQPLKYAKMLDIWTKASPVAAVARQHLAQYHHALGQAQTALEILETGRREHPEYEGYDLLLTMVRITLGEPEKIDPLIEKLGRQEVWRNFRHVFDETPVLPIPPPSQGIPEWMEANYLTSYLSRLIEMDRRDLLLESVRSRNMENAHLRNAHLHAMLYLASRGDRSPAIQSAAGALLADPFPSMISWDTATGFAISSPGKEWFARLLEDTRNRLPGHPALLLIESLWSSRLGEFEKSYDLLETLQKRLAPEVINAELVSEILTRPLWDPSVAKDRAATLLERARVNPGPGAADHPSVGVHAKFFLSTCRGETDRALHILESDVSPTTMYYNFILLWQARDRKDRTEVARLARIMRNRALASGRGAWALPEIRKILDEARAP